MNVHLAAVIVYVCIGLWVGISLVDVVVGERLPKWWNWFLIIVVAFLWLPIAIVGVEVMRRKTIREQKQK